jgi:glucokinase
MKNSAAIGIDLGGTKLAAALFTPDGEMVDRRIELLGHRQGSEVGTLITRLIRELLEFSQQRGYAVSGIGVAVPGIAYHETGEVWAPNIPGWEKYPLRQEIETTVDPATCRVVVDSDRACSILGEHWRGAARGCNHAIFIAVGTGIGLGVLVNGAVLRGAHDIAGATGWMALDRPFRKEYTTYGCFEYSGSGTGLARVVQDYLAQMPEYHGDLRSLSPEELTAHEIFTAYERQDSIALKTIARAIEYWGMAAANYVSLFDPDRIIFGGGVFGPAVRFIPAIRREAEKWAQPISMKKVAFVPSELGSSAILVGAGYLPLHTSGVPSRDTT